jgi:hypothetical protein
MFCSRFFRSRVDAAELAAMTRRNEFSAIGDRARFILMVGFTTAKDHNPRSKLLSGAWG